MKLVSLNTWGAAQGEIFFDYIKQQAKAVDIFCFQEIFSAPPESPKISSGAYMRLFEELTRLLPVFFGVFTERSSGYDFNGPVNFPVKYGMAVFVKKSIEVAEAKTVEMAASEGAKADPAEGIAKAQVLGLIFEKKVFSVINYHGPALPGSKLDTEERIACSETLKTIWENLGKKPKILCGDFNLLPETQSIKVLNEVATNLIGKFNITNTRNEISWKKYHNKQSFADYVFVSNEIKVKSFEVSYNEVSDHLPMILGFELG